MRLPWQIQGCDRGSGTDFFRQKAALARLEVEENTFDSGGTIFAKIVVGCLIFSG